MTTITTAQPTIGTAESPRLLLTPSPIKQATLHGGWWPRSRDAAAELPGLVTVLAARYGPIRQLMLNGGAWDNHADRLVVGTLVVRVGWFASLHNALLVATTSLGEQLELLVVAPQTPTATAALAARIAADPANTLRAPGVMTAATAISPGPDDGSHAVDTWDNEGGPLIAAAAQRYAAERSTDSLS